MQPDEVTKVEFINVPGLKYGDSNLDAVINYQVRRRYAGYVGGVSTMQGTKAGFNNSDGYFKYNVKKSEFSINYSFSYRSVEERAMKVSVLIICPQEKLYIAIIWVMILRFYTPPIMYSWAIILVSQTNIH